MPRPPRFPRSIRKYIRRRKAELRRQFADPAERDAKIAELVFGLRKQYHGAKAVLVTAPDAEERSGP